MVEAEVGENLSSTRASSTPKRLKNGKLDSVTVQPRRSSKLQPKNALGDTTRIAGAHHARSNGQVLACPECGTQKLFKDGLRYLFDGAAVQRWLCRNCGYRFSEKEPRGSTRPLQKTSGMSQESQHVSIIETQSLKGELAILVPCRVGASEGEAKNLEEEARQELAQREGTTQTAVDAKGKILEFAWHLRKQGRTPGTINVYVKYLTALVKRGADLNSPESVKDVISQQEHWGPSTKKQACIIYAAFCLKHRMNWADPPNYKPQRKLPFIPLEKEIDVLIAACGQRTGTILQTLKETGARIGEVLALKWTDVDSEHCTISINNPEKNSNPRIFKVSNKLISMLNALPKISVKVFSGLNAGVSSNFRQQRRRAALKLQNPRLSQIHFHTLRHWKATMEFAKTKNILHVMQVLGHKNIQNTMLYTQLIQFESDEYHVARAKTSTEEDELIKVGFELVRYDDVEKVAIYRKRK